ncbi:MAG: hypothetical protein IJW82_08440, partial [Clostridia bacterium]|nr:hypothetical protein [Clostridia bacterium]
MYDTDVFYLTQEKNDSDIITIPSSILEKKGYTVKFVGYKYQGELIIKDGNLITSTNYIKNGVWDIASSELIELKAEYTFTPNVYKVEFFNDSELINSLYIEYDSNEFYLERELLTKQNPTKLQDNQIESLYFSGYYTNNGIWIINQ